MRPTMLRVSKVQQTKKVSRTAHQNKKPRPKLERLLKAFKSRLVRQFFLHSTKCNCLFFLQNDVQNFVSTRSIYCRNVACDAFTFNTLTSECRHFLRVGALRNNQMRSTPNTDLFLRSRCDPVPTPPRECRTDTVLVLKPSKSFAQGLSPWKDHLLCWQCHAAVKKPAEVPVDGRLVHKTRVVGQKMFSCFYT